MSVKTGKGPEGRWECIYAAVRRIPPGRVATYGDIAELAGLGGHARQVGYALHALCGDSGVPWHRVVNARGEVSERSSGDSHELQRLLLEAESIEFDLRGRMDLARFRWRGKRRVSTDATRPRRSGVRSKGRKS
jgi:methylated-DNA-protein-cysteine methyltransferase-like protein